MLTLTNRIDMRPGAVPLVIHLGQYDSDFSLIFELYSSAGNFTVESGTTAMIRGTKTDGHAYDADATLDVSAKTVTVAGSEQMTAAKGRNVYELVLTKSGKVLSTANFILDVERAAMDADTIASESVLKELNAIIDSAATSTQAAADAASAADRAEDAADSVSSASAQIATNTADIADLKADLDKLNEGGLVIKDEVIAEDIQNWLDDHPEATTTVQDGSLTEAKFSNELKLKTIKDYVTPQMYGAEGDGVTDDTVAFIEALSDAAVVLVPSGTYVISSQIEITNKHRLIADGTVRIYTSVLNDYAFYVHGNEGDDYQSTNNYYDTYKGVWFGGTCGGITIINKNGTNGILFGTINDPSDGTIGANSIAQISNVGIQGYDVGLKITNYNNYLNAFNRVHFERCGDCVVFGDLGTTKKNSGEMFKFIDCIFSTSNTAVKYISQGWESSFIGCSIDFCIVGFYDSDYNRIFFSNGHIEGVGKKTLLDTVYGILVNQHEHTYVSLDNVAFDISNSRGTKLFYGTGNIHLGASFISTAEKYPSTVEDVFLSDHYITKTAVCFGQSFWRMYLSKDNNLVPDALLLTATIGTLGGNDITDQIKIYYKTGCTAEIVLGSMFSSQKAIRFNGNGNAPMTATVKVTIPVQPTKIYNAGFATYKHSDQSMARNLRAYFYDKNGNKLSETTAYLYEPDKAPKDAIFFPFISKQVTAPAGSVYAEFAYIVSVSPDASALAVGEYIDIQYMYCEEW